MMSGNMSVSLAIVYDNADKEIHIRNDVYVQIVYCYLPLFHFYQCSKMSFK